MTVPNANLDLMKQLRMFADYVSSLPAAHQKHWNLRYAELRATMKVREALRTIAKEMESCEPKTEPRP